MTRYFVCLNENNKILHGSTTRDDQVHDLYTYEVTEEIWNNSHKYQFVNGKWEEITNETNSGE